MTDVGLTEFARSLASEVEEAVQSEKGSLYDEVEFTRIVLDRLAEEGAVENPTVLWQQGHFGRVRYKITGYSMPEDDERLLLVATIYTGEQPPRTIPREEIMTACREAIRFYECSCKGLHETIEPSNTDASDLARRIYEAREHVSVLRILLLSDGATGLKSIDIKEAFDKTRVIVDLYGIERLYRSLGEGQSRDDIELDFEAEIGRPLPCLRAAETADYDAYLTAIPGKVLADVYDRYGTRLLELNVRAFLGVRGKKSVNAGLRATIREMPARFLAYNNGIVATVDALDLVDDSTSIGIRTVRGLQIVNGGQTTASLHRASLEKIDLSAIRVPVKIIRVGGEELDRMVSAVSRSANSQNTVQPADFSANDPFHVEVEKLANNTWLPDGHGRWFYERARGSYSAAEAKAATKAALKRRFAAETPKDRRFSKTDLAKYLNSWSDAPHMVGFGSQKNFQFFMQSQKERNPDGFLPDAAWFRAFVAKAILYRTAQKIVRSLGFPAYQANITTYTVAGLYWKTGGRIDFEVIWQTQAISAELCSLLRDWAVRIESGLRLTAAGRMPSEWAKKEACRDALRELDLELPQILPAELTSQTAPGDASRVKSSIQTGGLTREDLQHIDTCRRIDAVTWFHVAAWGQKTKKLHWKLSGIAKTMGEYALGGWGRSPSAKQAKWALEAYAAFAAEEENSASATL